MTSGLIENRLKALRSQLKSNRLRGFLIPKTDPHQNEYIPDHFDRLQWLTGFTGSAGIAVVLMEKAALFVDGRYSLQAEQEVKKDLFEILPLNWDEIVTWASQNLQAKSALGYDPWVMLTAQIKKLKAGSFKLKAVKENLVDLIWNDRPKLVQGPINCHSLDYAGQPLKDKINFITAKMKDKQIDRLILTQLDSIAWLLNIRGSDIPYNPVAIVYLILHKNGKGELFTGPLDDTLELQAMLGPKFTLKPYRDFKKGLKSACGEDVWVDPTSCNLGIIDALDRAEACVHYDQDPCVLPKAIKNKVEIAGARSCHIRDSAAVVQFLAWLFQEVPKGTVSELSAVKYLLSCRRRNDFFQQPSFETISGYKENGAIVHYRVTKKTDKTLKPEGLYLVDSGGQYLDGTTDVTRTVALGAPTLEQKDRFTRVLKGHIAIATAKFPRDTSGIQLDALARQYLWDLGLDFAHGTGHGVGSYLNVHEGPQSISPRGAPVPLQPGMILSNEPGYYEENAYGIRIESLVLVKPSSVPSCAHFLEFETLTLVPIDLSLVQESLLTADEKRWLNAYHLKVRDSLKGHLDPFSWEWLVKVTTEI